MSNFQLILIFWGVCLIIAGLMIRPRGGTSWDENGLTVTFVDGGVSMFAWEQIRALDKKLSRGAE